MKGSIRVRAPLNPASHSGLLHEPESGSAPMGYARFNAALPLSRIGETGVHLVATWALIDEALHREGDFSAHLTGVLTRDADGRLGTFEFPDIGANHVIATADDPEHAVQRAIVQPRLSAARVAALEGPIRSWTVEALLPWIAVGGGDFAPISELIPARVVAHLLGLPDRDVARHRAWAMIGGSMLAGSVTGAQLTQLITATGQMAEYLGQHLDVAARIDPAGGSPSLLALLAHGVERGEITREQAIGIAIVMFGAAGESTAALIGSTVQRLAREQEIAESLRANTNLIPIFVEEVARLEPPFNFHYRSVRRACELGGYALVPGDRLMLSWAAANRDPARFDDPDALRLDRRHPKQHLTFGRGSHFCIGAPLARLEARIVLEELLARTRQISPAPTVRPVYAPSIFVRRLERLPLSLHPA
jgi:cytochrome P450